MLWEAKPRVANWGRTMPSGFEIVSHLSAGATALFLDFDGTLTPLVQNPGDVRVERDVLRNLDRLATRLGGAMAIISGRDIASLDRFLSPHAFSASGVHGFEKRLAGGAVAQADSDIAGLQAADQMLTELADANAGLLVERKPGSLALHYRNRAELGPLCETTAQRLTAMHPGLTALRGKMVVELKGHTHDKGGAIREFLAVPPFQCRQAVFIGDDITDEAGFAAVQALGGIGIKVGAGATIAHHFLHDTDAVAEWLAAVLAAFETQ